MADAHKRIVTTIRTEWYLTLPTDAVEIAKVLSFLRQELDGDSERTFVEVTSNGEEIVFSYEQDRSVRHG